MDHVLREQQKRTAVPRKFSSYIKDIWYLQLKLSDRFRNNPKKIIKHPRFRAGYDFLLIREIASRDKSKLVLGGQNSKNLIQKVRIACSNN